MNFRSSFHVKRLRECKYNFPFLDITIVKSFEFWRLFVHWSHDQHQSCQMYNLRGWLMAITLRFWHFQKLFWWFCDIFSKSAAVLGELQRSVLFAKGFHWVKSAFKKFWRIFKIFINSSGIVVLKVFIEVLKIQYKQHPFVEVTTFVKTSPRLL